MESLDIKVNISIDDIKFDRDVNEDLKIDPYNLDENLSNQSALYAYYSVLLQKANAIKDQAEFDYDKTLNFMIDSISKRNSDGKKLTAQQINAFVNSQQEVLEKKQLFLNASAAASQLYALVRALEHKKDSLIALAYKKREELNMMANNAVMVSKKKFEVPKSGIEDE